jgi:hypothetical protein
MSSRLTVLILGGYGTFGGRLAKLLADEERLTLLIAGRSLKKADAFCVALRAKAKAQPVSFDRNGDVAAQLRTISPHVIVDASGPFQSYGTDQYRVVRAAIELGNHYLDFADASEFVMGIAQFDKAARERRVFVLSGVSSFPVLTAAVVRRLAEGMTRIDSIAAGIAPSPYAGVGLNVVRAIAGYSGKPIRLIHGGKRTTGHGFVDSRRYTIAPPGKLPLHSRRFSLVDVPDLLVLPQLWSQVRSIWVGAGPVPEVLHRALNALAWLVRWRALPSLLPIAPLMSGVINVLRWGEHRGGMFVSVKGIARDGEAIERSWHLLAEGEAGPFIPSMACEVLIRRMLDGRLATSGARAATEDIELSDYEAIFARREIDCGRRETSPATSTLPLYQRLLGDAWFTLPEPVRTMHDLRSELVAEGMADVARGNNVFARLIGSLFGFPPAGHDVPVKVHFRPQNGREVWERSFASSRFRSVHEAGTGRFDRLLRERFGPFAFGLALVVDQSRMRLVVRRWTFLGVPLPLALAPRGESYEHADGGRFNFHVEIDLPLIGRLAAYRGWLKVRA